MRLYLLYTSFSFSGVNTRTFRIFMTYPPSPIHNVEDKKNVVWYRCNNIVLGGKEVQIQSLKFLHVIVSMQIVKQLYFRCLSWRENISPPLRWPSNLIMLLDSNNYSAARRAWWSYKFAAFCCRKLGYRSWVIPLCSILIAILSPCQHDF